MGNNEKLTSQKISRPEKNAQARKKYQDNLAAWANGAVQNMENLPGYNPEFFADMRRLSRILTEHTKDA